MERSETKILGILGTLDILGICYVILQTPYNSKNAVSARYALTALSNHQSPQERQQPGQNKIGFD